ncbi:unnamed protein product [Schistocephalus solidus]|uniref:Melanoma inhibitory activity protein 3 n=1 Tax=Schistocephalus solidus TaxID=70667 RepID=A0A183T679_SCHSO|nr:unnamed protein product [Schistocephalus solidus]
MFSPRPYLLAIVWLLYWSTAFGRTDTTQYDESFLCGNQECSQPIRLGRLIRDFNFADTFLSEGTNVAILGEHALHPNILLARHADRTFYLDSSLVHQGETLVSSFQRTVISRESLQPKLPESNAEGKTPPTPPEHVASERTASTQQVKTGDVPSSFASSAPMERPDIPQVKSNSPSNQLPRSSAELAPEPQHHTLPPKQVTPETVDDTKSNQKKQMIKSSVEDTVQVSASAPKSAKAAQESAEPSHISTLQEPVSKENLPNNTNFGSLPSSPTGEPMNQPELHSEKPELLESPLEAPKDIEGDGSFTDTQPHLSAAQNQSPTSKEVLDKHTPLQKDAVATEELHGESVPKVPLKTGILVDPIVAHETVSNHPEPVYPLPVGNAANVEQARSIEENERPSTPAEAKPSVEEILPITKNERLHEDALARASVKNQGGESLPSGYSSVSPLSEDQKIHPLPTDLPKPSEAAVSEDLSTVSDTPKPSLRSTNLKPEAEATTVEISENLQLSDSELRLSPSSKLEDALSEDFKPLKESIVVAVSETSMDNGNEKAQVRPDHSLKKQLSSESNPSNPSGMLPIENKNTDSSIRSGENEGPSSIELQSGPGDSSPHTTTPMVFLNSLGDPQNVNLPTNSEPSPEKPTSIKSQHAQDITADAGYSSSPRSQDSPESPHLPHMSEDLAKPSENSSRQLKYSGFIQCLLQSANRSLPVNTVTSKSALSTLTLFLYDNLITLAEKALTFLSPKHVKRADDFLYTILGVPLSCIVAWWFFLFSAFATYTLIRVGAHMLIGSSNVGGVQQRSLVDWLAIEEHANQLAARLADQEEANARLTIWTMELSARCEEQMRSQLNTESSSQAQLREVRSALNQSRLETKELQTTHDALVQQISSMKCDRASLEERLQAATERYEAAEKDWRLSRAELNQSHSAQVQALQEERAELLARLNIHRERIDEMETAMKELMTSSQKLEEELVARDRELAGLRDMFIQLKSFELSLSQANSDAVSLYTDASQTVSKENRARPMLVTSSSNSDQDTADNSDWGAEVDELANEVNLDGQLAVAALTNSQETGEPETRERQSERLQQVLANFLDVGKLRADLSALNDQLKAETDRCKQETELRSQLQAKLAILEESNATLMQKCSQAEDDRSAALKKLEILSDYFKEREVVMQRDLGRQALSESEANDELNYLRQRAKSLDVEVKALREQVTSARHELVENERASRRQITQLDKRLHENWLAARASENLVKELRDENTALRQKIGDGEKRTLQQLISRGPPMSLPLLHQPFVALSGSRKPDNRPSSRQFGNNTSQMTLKQTAGSRHTPSFLPPPPSLPGMPPFTTGAPGVPFVPPPPPPPPPGLIPPKGAHPLLPPVQRTFSNRNSPLLPGWEVMQAPSPSPAAPQSNSGSSRSAKR